MTPYANKGLKLQLISHDKQICYAVACRLATLSDSLYNELNYGSLMAKFGYKLKQLDPIAHFVFNLA